MSVHRFDYIIIGYKLPYKFNNIVTGKPINWFEDDYLPYIEGRKSVEFSIFHDYESFAVFGKVLARGDDYGQGFGFKELKIDENDYNRVKDKFIEMFGGFDVMDIIEASGDTDPKLFVFSLFS